ncbi:hypothetical protein RI367_001485 [Sorochytrium milnesiophthora]
MAAPANATDRTVHVIYDAAYTGQEYSNDVEEVLQHLGYATKTWYIDGNPASYECLPSKIPADDYIFLHVDLPGKVAKGSQIRSVRFLEKAFKYVAGFTSEYSENSIWKSVMNELFAKHGVPHAETVRIETIEQLKSDEVMEKLQRLPKPVFIKVDDGFNSEGLSERCIVPTMEEVTATVGDFLAAYGPVTVQPFLNGREFTVAVSPACAFHPVERLFATGERFSPAGGTASERLLPHEETALVEECKRVAHAAYRAVAGDCYSYGRVDLRCDTDGNVYALEVNNTCSFRPTSYLAMSCAGAGSSREELLRDIMEHQKQVWRERDAAVDMVSAVADLAVARNPQHVQQQSLVV